jgi:AraC family transcriptional regulator
MNRVVRLLATEAIALERFDHEPGMPHRDPERECSTHYGVHFVEAGSFRLRTTDAWDEITDDSLFVTTPGLEFSCAHDDEHPSDRCVSVSYSEQAVESARASWRLADTSRRDLTNRLAYLRHTLGRPVPGEEARVEALAGAVLWALSSKAARHPLFRPQRFAWYAARVDRAKAMIATHYAEPLSLSAMARETGMSVFHFARIFAELEGCPPHRFLRDVRLTHARSRLREGAGVTDTCYAVGFGSLSHFVTMFRRRYGVRPSDVR